MGLIRQKKIILEGTFVVLRITFIRKLTIANKLFAGSRFHIFRFMCILKSLLLVLGCSLNNKNCRYFHGTDSEFYLKNHLVFQKNMFSEGVFNIFCFCSFKLSSSYLGL